jgi:hypothetical protein
MAQTLMRKSTERSRQYNSTCSTTAHTAMATFDYTATQRFTAIIKTRRQQYAAQGKTILDNNPLHI